MTEEKKNLEETIKEKVAPLVEETMEKSWGITIPQIEEDIADKLRNPKLQIYVPADYTFQQAKRFFKAEFIKKELKLHKCNISHLAKTLDLDRRSIHRAIKELDIDMEEIRHKGQTKELYQESLIDQQIRSTLEQYKEFIQPEKLERMYSEVPTLSRNIAKFIPHKELTWKEAEREFERQFFTHALQENNWSVAKTATKLDIRVETLHRKVKRLRLKEVAKTI